MRLFFPFSVFKNRPATQRGIGLALFTLFFLTSVPVSAASVVMYHRFGEAGYPSTNITLEQFEAHLLELTEGGYTVLGLMEIISKLRDGETLPDSTVGVSIDDAYLSVYDEAWPRLRDAGIPFTLFVSTDLVDRGGKHYMNWAQLRELADAGVTIGGHTASHLHMATAGDERNRAEIAKSNQRLEEKLGRRPELFAYPYGEASLAAARIVEEAGYKAAFGQHSGTFDGTGDFYFLPRFPLNEHYGDSNRFRLVTRALPLPVSDVVPPDPLIVGENPPSFGFTVSDEVSGLGHISCFASHVDGAVRVQHLGVNRVEVRMTKPFPQGRSRINCTMPASEGRWRWFGRQFFVPG